MRTKKGLSERQKKILDFISDYYSTNGYSPSVREIGAHVGLNSSASVQNQINNLTKFGYLSHSPLRSRTLMPSELIKKTRQMVSVPIVGRISAGSGVDAIEEIEDYINLPLEIAKYKDCFALYVKGDSMKDAGILDKDLAIIKRQNTADQNQIVAVGIENEALIKRIKYLDNKVILISENPSYSPLVIPADKVTIFGILTGLIRHY